MSKVTKISNISKQSKTYQPNANYGKAVRIKVKQADQSKGQQRRAKHSMAKQRRADQISP